MDLARLGIAIGAGLGSLGAGIGISMTSTAYGGLAAKKPEDRIKAILPLLLSEALGIYAMIFLFLGIRALNAGILADKILAAGIIFGLGNLGAGVALGGSGSGMSLGLAENEKSFMPTLVVTVLGEAIAIYALVMAIYIMRRKIGFYSQRSLFFHTLSDASDR